MATPSNTAVNIVMDSFQTISATARSRRMITELGPGGDRKESESVTSESRLDRGKSSILNRGSNENIVMMNQPTRFETYALSAT